MIDPVDKKRITFWLSNKIDAKMHKKLAKLEKEGEPHTITAFITRLIKNAVE